MIAGLPLSFAEPILLLGLLGLPALWWLLRVMPPRPRRLEFPPPRLLFAIAPREETPSRTPWWLTALRLLAAALAYHAAMAVAPLIIGVLAIVGLIYDTQLAREQCEGEARRSETFRRKVGDLDFSAQRIF